MNVQFLKDALGWGLLLWLIGYLLGFLLFALVPPSQIGWYIMSVGIVITLWVLFKKIQGGSLQYYFNIGIVWVLIAIVCDYLFLALLLKPADGYYKPDVYLYYILTLTLPVIVGWWKLRKQSTPPPTL